MSIARGGGCSTGTDPHGPVPSVTQGTTRGGCTRSPLPSLRQRPQHHHVPAGRTGRTCVLRWSRSLASWAASSPPSSSVDSLPSSPGGWPPARSSPASLASTSTSTWQLPDWGELGPALGCSRCLAAGPLAPASAGFHLCPWHMWTHTWGHFCHQLSSRRVLCIRAGVGIAWPCCRSPLCLLSPCHHPGLRPSGPSAPSWPQTVMEELKPCSQGCSCLLQPITVARGSAAVFFSRAAAPASPGQRRTWRGSPFAWWRPRSQAGAAAWLASTEVGFALPSVCLHWLRVSVFL